MTQDIFNPTPARQSNKPKGTRRAKRIGQTLKRLLQMIDDPQTTHEQRLDLVKRAERLSRQ